MLRSLYFLLVVGWVGCRGPAAELGPEPSEGAVLGEGGSDGTVVEETGAGGARRPSTTMAVADAGEGATDGSAGSVGEGCGAQSVTLAEIHAGKVRGTVPVAVKGLVASSQKFLVSEAKSGSCLWGAFAAAEGEQGAGSGLFLVSFGAPHAEGESCMAGADGLPDDLQPGERVEVEGKLDEYAPASCAGTAAAQQLMIDAACPLRRLGRGAAPEAVVIDSALASRLALGKDQQLLRDWSGALVRLEGVEAVQDADDGDAVFPFGVVRLEQTSLEVHSRLYYFDLSDGGPRASGKAPRYDYPTAFGAISGIVFLDYCSWVLAPRDRCSDLEPASSGCAAQAQRP
jgi:hypothetical protein